MSGKFYSHYTSLGSPWWGDGTTVTTITIPAECGEEPLLGVLSCIKRHGGKLWNPPNFHDDGSLILTPITFINTDQMKNCCEEIEAFLDSFMPITFKELPNGKIELRFNIKFLFLMLQESLEKMKPAIDFIEANGGWDDGHEFKGFSSLEQANHDGTLDTKITESMNFISTFMGKYVIGDKMMQDKEFKTVPHNLK